MIQLLDEKLPPVTVFPVEDLHLEYTADKKEVYPGIGGRAYLHESMIYRQNPINVMDGYDSTVPRCHNHHSIFHLYKFEEMTHFLDRFPIVRKRDWNEMSTRFLLCRYVICDIDDALQSRKPMELIAIRKNGDIWIGSNKTIGGRKWAGPENSRAAYGGLNFAKQITKDSDVNFEKLHSVVKKLRLENRSLNTAMTLFISSVARAFDVYGQVIEVKTASSNVAGKLQNLPAVKARNWWLRASLSGAQRIVYGLRRNDVIHEVQEAKLEELTSGHFHFNSTHLFSFVFSLFKKINYVLDEDNSMCLIKMDGFDAMSITQTTSDSLKRSPIW